MGQPADPRRLLLHEKLLSVHKSRTQDVPDDVGESVAERQPGNVLGAREIRSEVAHPENRRQPAAPENQHGRRPRRSLRPLRLPPRNRARLRLPLNSIRSLRMIAPNRRRRGASPLRPISATNKCPCYDSPLLSPKLKTKD